MWVFRAAAILWAGFVLSALATVIAPGLGSGLFALVVMSSALMLSLREAMKGDRSGD